MAGGRLPALGTALWIADLLGWCSFVLLLLLLLLPLRRRRIEVPPLIAHSAHRQAGYLMLVLVIVHAVASVLGEPETIAYWLPTAPLHMLLGQASAVVLIALCWMAALSVRARRYGAGSNFHRTHLLLSLAVLALSLAHVAGSAAIAFSPSRLMPWAVLSAAAALLPPRSPGN
jgi:predicted ferric reductase